ncbi:hypothetical protein [Nitrosopumilus ureiphilus]|uniref:CDC48 N-terminal subdomain domain-containing protein n=1 Tax=Nitrosopumilus ureiphilus TaxID=1470067 RepID=A0A7D5M5B4_9ARCH|nr:hypothetical protein [Nitrosopumilus ureiphilus]QLH06775.1 hypothetical protein C5F50_06560 [Nitrosopumilus ureiphilus]
MKNNDLDFKVLEAYTRDIGRGIARIDQNTMDTMSITIGDIIEISGKQKAVAKCAPLYPADENKKIIRFDGLIRNNCKTEIGNQVFLRKIKTAKAETITVIPTESIPAINEDYLADALESVPLILQQNIMVPYFGGRLTFQVASVIPCIDDNMEAVIVTQKTIFHIQESKISFPEEGDISAKRQFILHQFWRLEDLDKEEFDDLISRMNRFYKELKNKKDLGKP